jgi:hypothetical protein
MLLRRAHPRAEVSAQQCCGWGSLGLASLGPGSGPCCWEPRIDKSICMSSSFTSPMVGGHRKLLEAANSQGVRDGEWNGPELGSGGVLAGFPSPPHLYFLEQVIYPLWTSGPSTQWLR